MKKSFKFHDLIECICERTGAHIQQGDVYYQGFKLPQKAIIMKFVHYYLVLYYINNEFV